jgi:transporter family-2 protein
MYLGTPFWAGVVSYVGGLSAMLIVAIAVGPKPSPSAVTAIPWPFFFSGVFGAIFIGGIITVPCLGSATTTALMVVGQLVASMLYDHFGVLELQPTTTSDQSSRLAGALLLTGGVILIRYLVQTVLSAH